MELLISLSIQSPIGGNSKASGFRFFFNHIGLHYIWHRDVWRLTTFFSGPKLTTIQHHFFTWKRWFSFGSSFISCTSACQFRELNVSWKKTSEYKKAFNLNYVNVLLTKTDVFDIVHTVLPLPACHLLMLSQESWILKQQSVYSIFFKINVQFV